MDAKLQEIFDISQGALIMAFQEAAKVCADYAGVDLADEGKDLAVKLLDMARSFEPDGRDLALEWDPELAALVDGWR